ncbi:hypothetical protein ASE48_06745 [Mycobacterium sp. Root265]|nr:hypothetical protein ASE48_06745 [Mycobacterium sp. Root265]
MAHSKREIGVLVIDQLDIVSSTSGRSPIFFECVKEMLETASAMPNLRVVLSCRTFDSTNDPRLRRLVSSEHTKLVTIGSLAKADVHTTIEGFGFDAQQLTAVQSQMFSVPLHLALLAEVAPALRDESEVLSLAEPKDLFQAFWTHKHREIQHRLGREPAWTQVFDALVDYMSDNQVLRAPAAIADQWSSDLSEMTSSHVVTRDGNHIAFFHESFFDYVFARRFTSRQYTVADLLTADQGLFRRAQVRQILAYNRGLTPQYSEDLKYLLTAAPVRFHLRDVVLAWLARVSPTAEEWTLVRPFLEDAGSPLFARAWRTVATPNWFAHLDDSGLLTDCLHSDDESRVNLALRALACGDGKFLDRAVELLEPLVHESDLWSTRLIWLLQQVDLTSHRPSFDLLLELLDSGKLGATGFADREFWRLHDKLPVAKPDWANQLLGRYLAERIAAAGAYGPRSPIDTTAELIPRQNQLRDFIILAATRRPDSFIRNVWPEIVRIAESTMFAERDDGGRLRPDHIWPFNGSTDHRGDFRQELLAGAEIAFAELGRESPDQLLDLANSMSATPSETVVHVLFAGFAANPATLADQVIRLLGAHPNWLQVSWSTGHAWGARRLIAAITPFASSGALEQLTAQLLDYYPLLERSPKAYREFGLTQFTLLGGIPPEYRSPGVTKRFAEWQRKFGVQDLLEPTGVHGGFVQSPLASTAIDRMSDTNWRGAIARYNGDDTTFQNSEGTLVGGALQLANQLEAAAKASPRRFANLALTLPDSTDVRYFNAILRGVAGCETPLPTGLIEELLTRCHTLPDRPCGMYIATPLLRSEELQISESMCDLIIEYAMNDPDPGDDGFRVAADNIDENLLYRGLNSVRGAISEVIARLISQDARNIDPLMPAVLSLVSDRDMGVRSLAARCVISLEHWESSNAVLAFEKLVDGCTDHLLATRYVYEILRARIVSRPSSARTVIDRMARSEVGEVQMHGAMLNTLAALLDGRAADLATAGVSGTEYQRLGAAKVYAANRIGTRFAEQCAEPLVLLLNDGSQLVRDAAAAVITDFSEVEVDEYRSVVEALISTRAADEHWDDLILMVGESIASAPDLALMICEKILLDTTDDLRSLQHPDLVSLILLRVSIDFTGDTRTRALDLIDLLLQYEIRSTERALVLHDRGLE